MSSWSTRATSEVSAPLSCALLRLAHGACTRLHPQALLQPPQRFEQVDTGTVREAFDVA